MTEPTTERVEIRTVEQALKWGDRWKLYAEIADRRMRQMVDSYEDRIFHLETRLVIAEAEKALAEHAAPRHRFSDEP